MGPRICSFLAVAVSCAVPAFAAEASARSDRAAWRDAFSFLGLSATQIEVVRSVRADHARALLALTGQAAQLVADKTAAPSDTEARLMKLCQRSQAVDAAQRARLRAPLSEEQLQRLTQLEQALNLLPVIESAQAAGLIADRTRLPLVGLPSGSVEAEYSWRRVAALPLPGCPSSVLHREVELEGNSRVRPASDK